MDEYDYISYGKNDVDMKKYQKIYHLKCILNCIVYIIYFTLSVFTCCHCSYR